MKLSVVIVSYKVQYYLWQCLRSVFRAAEGLDVEVWVVDNNSQDGSLEYLQQYYPSVHYIQNDENVGFSRANNQALRQATGEYVLLLNPDTVLTERTFTDCLSFLDSHPDVGAVGVKMHNPYGRFALESRRGLPTPWVSFCKMCGLTALFPKSRRFGRYYMRYLPTDEPCEIEVISGAFNMIRRNALNEIGLLDERFFMYGEDIDLSYRMLMAGWKNYFLPTPIIHYKGESTQKSSFRYVHIFYEAMLLFFDKHFSQRYFLLSVLIRLAVRARAGIDMLQRMVQKIRLRLCPPSPADNAVHMEDYRLFDSETTAYSDMIDQLTHSDHRLMLGTRNPENGTIVLPYNILSC
ncbi:MAG: glycosyltransferase family 2 protein [Bacteroidaceae bacterium]|nr:glycosyltransferase family 2 protein [Bacteroidaceae bacterium]